jgi:helix-turn-helix protein
MSTPAPQRRPRTPRRAPAIPPGLAVHPEPPTEPSGYPSAPVEWERLARTHVHPLRVSILEILGIDGGRVLSANDLCHELQIPLSNTNYHVKALEAADLIKRVGSRPVRGATETFYALPTVPASHAAAAFAAVPRYAFLPSVLQA